MLQGGQEMLSLAAEQAASKTEHEIAGIQKRSMVAYHMAKTSLMTSAEQLLIAGKELEDASADNIIGKQKVLADLMLKRADDEVHTELKKTELAYTSDDILDLEKNFLSASSQEIEDLSSDLSRIRLIAEELFKDSNSSLSMMSENYNDVSYDAPETGNQEKMQYEALLTTLADSDASLTSEDTASISLFALADKLQQQVLKPAFLTELNEAANSYASLMSVLAMLDPNQSFRFETGK